MRPIYFDNAATTFPKPECVCRAVSKAVRYLCANPGRSSHRLSVAAAEKVYGCRCKLAATFGGAEERAVFTLSATYAINLAVKSILRRGDHVLISDIEHNATLRPIAELAQRSLITYDVYKTCPSPSETAKNVAALIKPNTRLVCACHHSNICNITLPLREIGSICKRHGAYFLVDASQSAGSHKIDLEADLIDVVCLPAHKGLYGIPGCGAVIFGSRLDPAELSTVIEGGNGVGSSSVLMPSFLPERLEAGTLPLPAIIGLSAGLDFVSAVGQSTLLRHEKQLYTLLSNELSDVRGITVHTKNSGSILLLSADGILSEDLARELDGYGICVRAGLHCAPLAHQKLNTPNDGAVRVSFGAFNTEREVKQLVYACQRIVKTHR